MLNPMILERVLEDEYCYDRFGAKLFPINRMVTYDVGGLKVIKDHETNQFMFLPKSHYDADQFQEAIIDFMNNAAYASTASPGMRDIFDIPTESFRAEYYCKWYEEPEIHPDEIMVLLNGVTEE